MTIRQLRVARTLLLIALAGIVYASVYPLRLRDIGGDFLPVLIRTWRARLGLVLPGDIAANFLLYAPLGFLAFFSVPPEHSRASRILIATAFGFALSMAMESVQLFEADRVSSFNDVVVNSAGALFGGLVAARLTRQPYLLQRPAPLFLFGTWTAAVMLLAIDRNAHLTRMVTLPFCIAAVAAMLLLLEWLGRRSLVPATAVAVLLVVALLWRELQPFQFSSRPQPFEWIPFAASFRASRGSGLVVFIDKVFFYGATVWFARTLTRSLPAAAVLVAAVLAFLEAVQTYMPARTPEISDPVLALLVGFVLYLLETPASKKFAAA